MSKIKLTGSNSGYVEISSAADAGNLTLALPTSGTALLSNADNVFSGITTFTGLNITDDVTFNGGSYDVLWDASDNQLEFGDNAKLSFGASSDLQLYHDGNHSYIHDTGTGTLRVQSSQMNVIKADGSETMAIFVADAEVGLFFNNSKKIETTNTGAVVTGICTATSFSGSGENLTRTTQLSHRNLILNGRFDVFQRFLPGSQVTCNAGSNFYCMDRWYARGEGSLGVFKLIQQDIQSEGQGAHAAARVQVTTNVTPGAGDVYKIAQRIEGSNIRHLNFGTSAAKTITLSFLVKSTVTGTHGGSLMNSAQNRSYPFTYTISSANTWEQKSITIPGDTGGTWVTNFGIGLELNFDMGSGSSKRGSAGGSWIGARAEGATGAVQLISTSSANWYVTRVQIEVGTVSTPFENISYPEELARCQRYYYMHARGSSNWIGVATVYQDNNLFCHVKFPVTMRSNPSRDVANGSSYFLAYSNGGNDGFNTFSGSWNTQTNGTGLNAYSNDGVSGRSAGHSAMIITNHADAYLGFNADL